MKEIREMRKGEADEYSERLRKLKNEAFSQSEKAEQINKVC